MSAPLSPKVAGGVLIVAALAGIAAISFFPRGSAGPGPAVVLERRDSPRVASAVRAREAEGVAPDSLALPLPPERDTVASPLDSAAADSAMERCVADVKEMLKDAARDSSGVEITAVAGIRPPPGRGPDSLLVEGTAHGRDATPAVWHCAVIANGTRGIGKLTAIIEDGWPGVRPAFDAAHAVTLAAETACLEQTKMLFREYDFRGVRSFRDIDTLHVRGEAIPLNLGDLAGDFHCRAVVRNGRVVSIQAKAG